MKKLLLPLLLVCSSLLQAQVTFQVGTSTNTSNNVPITAYYGYSYSQMVYHQDELIAAGVVPDTITKLRFYLVNDPGGLNNCISWNVYLGNVTRNSFASNSDWEPAANLTQVFSGNVVFPAAQNWMEITLSTPFVWDGTSNILIAVDENTPNYSASDVYWRATPSVNNSAIYYRSDSNNPNPASPPGATSRNSSFANVEIVMNASQCNGTPVHDVVTVSGPVCSGQPVTAYSDANNASVGMSYQWQYNSGAGWTNFVNNVNSWYFVTSELTATSDIRVIVTCTNSGLADTSGLATATIYSLPPVQITPAGAGYCSGSPVSLTASGATSYTWLPGTDLDNTNQPMVTSTPSANITYTITGTDGNGCSNTASVSLTSVASLTPGITFNPQTLCSSGTPVTLNISGLPVLASGTYEYQFLAADAITVLQPWSTSAAYTFTPPADSVYTFYYQVRSSACPAEMNTAAMISFPVGFGADVTVIPFNCQHTGTIGLSDIFGQLATDTVFYNPLNSPANADSISFTGVAAITAGRAVLTPSATGVSGYMQISNTPVTLGYNNAMHLSFLMTADQPINNYGTGGADGITYSFGDDATPAGIGSPHNGTGTKLRLSFDSANNGSENGNASGIYLVFGWGSSTAFGPGNSEVIAYSSNTASWKTKTDVPVDFIINTNGKASLTVDGVLIFDNIQMPASYLTADVTSWKHLFSAGTGGDALRQAVSGLSITSDQLWYGINPVDAVNPPQQWQPGTEFANLQPGNYTVWIANPDNINCRRNLGTFPLLNTNPAVNWPSDTVICSGDSVLLDAGNPGNAYSWSTNATTQTITVAQAGAYAVFITDTVGCTGIGSIQVVEAPVPSATGIYASGMFPTVFYSVLNPVNANHYNWNFGDGNTLMNGPSTIGHTYAAMNTYNVTVTLSNDFDCDSVTLTKTVLVNANQLDIEDLNGFQVQVYPNPASEWINIQLDDYTDSWLFVYTVSGAQVYSGSLVQPSFSVSNLSDGVYIMKVVRGENTSLHRVIVQH